MFFSKHILNNYLLKLLFLSLLASTAFAYSGGTGEPNSPYQIASVSDWQQLMTSSADWDKHFIMTADVNLQGISLTPVGDCNPFSGVMFTGFFDGGGHIIQHADIKNPITPNFMGLFGVLGSGGQIRNLGIEDVNLTGNQCVGGLVGYNYFGSISNCYSKGAVSGTSYIGGLVGTNNGIINNCYSAGSVSGSYVGGLVGDTFNGGSISNSYSTSNVSGSSYVGGLVGLNGDNISNCYSTGTVSGSSGSFAVGGLIGLNDAGDISNCYSTGDVNGTDCIGGLAGYNNTGSISNCNSTGDVNGSSCVGGLIGENYAGITNCYSTGKVHGNSIVGGLAGANDGDLTGSYSSGNVTSDGVLGGLVGYNTGFITASYAAGSAYGFNTVGGLVGDSNGTIVNCYAIGDVNGTYNVGGLAGCNRNILTYCYAAGSVSGGEYPGGLVGLEISGSVTSSFWDVNTSGQETSDAGQGKTTAQMKTESTFTSAGWDFSYSDGDEMDWFIQIDEYPILTWQISPVDIYTDGKNNFRDFAVLARYWMRDDCRSYNYFCDGADLNSDGIVDIDDLKKFASYWLQSGIYE